MDKVSMDSIIELGNSLLKGCVIYYDLVNNTDNYSICVGMQSKVESKTTGKKYRYTVKIEKEEIENE